MYWRKGCRRIVDVEGVLNSWKSSFWSVRVFGGMICRLRSDLHIHVGFKQLGGRESLWPWRLVIFIPFIQRVSGSGMLETALYPGEVWGRDFLFSALSGGGCWDLYISICFEQRMEGEKSIHLLLVHFGYFYLIETMWVHFIFCPEMYEEDLVANCFDSSRFLSENLFTEHWESACLFWCSLFPYVPL